MGWMHEACKENRVHDKSLAFIRQGMQLILCTIVMHSKASSVQFRYIFHYQHMNLEQSSRFNESNM